MEDRTPKALAAFETSSCLRASRRKSSRRGAGVCCSATVRAVPAITVAALVVVSRLSARERGGIAAMNLATAGSVPCSSPSFKDRWASCQAFRR